MNVDFVTVGVSVLTSLAASLAKPAFDWWKARNDAQTVQLTQAHQHQLATLTQTHQHELASNQQALELYKQLFETLNGQMIRLSAEVAKLEEAHHHCQEENAKLRADISILSDRIDFLTAQLPDEKQQEPVAQQ